MYATLVSLLVMVGIAPQVESASSAASITDASQLSAAGLAPYWAANLPFGAGESSREAHLLDDAIYVYSSVGGVYSVQAETGLLRWAIKLTKPEYRIMRPAHFKLPGGRSVVAMTTSTHVTLLDRYTGDVVRAYPLPAPEGSAAVGYQDEIYLGSADGRFYSYWLNSRVPDSELAQRWQVVAGGRVSASPMFDSQGRLIFASEAGWVFACRPFDKSLEWSFRVGGAVTADPALDATGVYLACADRSLYKVDGTNGRQHWRHRFPDALSTSPVVAEHTVFQYCDSTGLSAIDAETGNERWVIPTGRWFLANQKEQDAILTLDRKVMIVDHTSGQTVAQVDAAAAEFAVPNPVDEAWYLCAADGRMQAVRPDNAPYLRKQQIIAAKNVLNIPPGSRESAPSADSGAPLSKPEEDVLRSRWDRPAKTGTTSESRKP